MANFIAKATKNKGGLHRSLGVKEGEKIPASTIKKRKSSLMKKKKAGTLTAKNTKVLKEINLAKTLKGLAKRRSK